MIKPITIALSIIVISLTTSCSIFVKQNIKEKNRKNTEDCVIRLVNEGIKDELAYPICKDIYDQDTGRDSTLKEDRILIKTATNR